MYQIGNIKINSKVVLAPMAGVTSLGYRKYMRLFSAEVFVTEMVSDMGLIYGNKETDSYISFDEEKYTGVQLFGHDPETIKKAAEIAQKANKNIDFFDFNMGCPVNKVTKTGSGSALLKNPKLCGDIIRSIKSVTDKPVTAKIRLGWDDKSINFMEVIDELVKAGADAIAIHARTRKELYSGLPHYDLLKDLGEKLPVPLIVSGNIYTLDDAINAINITKASAVMVARGGMGNPYLIKQINHYYETGERLLDPSLDEQIKYCLQLADYLIEEKGEKRAMMIYRGIATQFFKHFPNAKAIRSKLAKDLNTKQDLINILEEIEKEL